MRLEDVHVGEGGGEEDEGQVGVRAEEAGVLTRHAARAGEGGEGFGILEDGRLEGEGAGFVEDELANAGETGL